MISQVCKLEKEMYETLENVHSLMAGWIFFIFGTMIRYHEQHQLLCKGWNNWPKVYCNVLLICVKLPNNKVPSLSNGRFNAFSWGLATDLNSLQTHGDHDYHASELLKLSLSTLDHFSQHAVQITIPLLSWVCLCVAAFPVWRVGTET